MVKLAPVVVVAVLAAGCSGEAVPAAVSTVTVTATVTAAATPSQAGHLELTVFTDGCGVIRSESGPGAFHNLTWVFRDPDGFQVLGRNAEGETRYRYFRSGAFTVTLEAWAGGRYAPVSNTVTVRC